MGYRLGVDLGTTFTSAAVRTDGWPAMVGLGNRALAVPSVLFFAEDGSVVVGEAAERRGAVEPDRVVREFKRRLGDQVPVLVAGSPHPAYSLMAELLSWVVATTTERQGEPPEQVVVTHPASWGPYKMDLFAQMVRHAGLEGAGTVSEPEAAATLCAERNRLSTGDQVAVYDLGGGTFDAAVLRKTETGFDLLGTPEGLEQLGGVDFDEAVFAHVVAGTRDELAGLPMDDPEVRVALTRLRRDCVEAKESLTSDTETVVPITLPALHTSVRVVRSELEGLIRPTIGHTVSAMHRALRSAEVEPADLAAIVLVGGSSRIPLVGQLLMSEFGRPLALDTHPKHDVALGATLVADVEAVGLTEPPAARSVDPPGPRTVPLPPTPAPGPEPPPTVPPPAAPPRRHAPVVAPRRLPPWLAPAGVVVAVAAVVVGAALLAWALLGNDDGEPSTSGPSVLLDDEVIYAVRTGGAVQYDTLAVASVDGGGGTPFVSDPTGLVTVQTFPTISEDRSTVVFLGGPEPAEPEAGDQGELQLWAVDGDGEDLRPLTDQDVCPHPGPPAIDPSGTRVAFVCIGADGTAEPGLVVLDVGSGVDSEVERVATAERAGPPTWLDDDTLTYQRIDDRATREGPLVNVQVSAGEEGTGEEISPTLDRSDGHPDWSSDAELLASQRTVDAGGEEVKYTCVWRQADDQLTCFDEVEEQRGVDPVFAPDSHQLVYANGRDLYLVDMDAAEPQPQPLDLGGADGTLWRPAWGRR